MNQLLSVTPPARLVKIFGSQPQDIPAEYLHWDKLRHLTPPDSLTSEEWWMRLKVSRSAQLRVLPLTDADGATHAAYTVPDDALRLLHQIDQRCSGEIAMAEVVTADHQAQQHYLVNSLMEEAIRSSQLEGATTSRQMAKEMLQTGRRPTDRSERMILNNYRALLFMRDEIGDRLTPAAILELHRILTEGTLDDPDAAGRIQTADEERVVVKDVSTNRVLHVPPPAEQLAGRMQALCDFANREPTDAEQFMHPVVRAILLHFWLAYDHPFEDGNGRTARALFYWDMRTRGYWLVEYLSISKILRKAPAKYAKAFLLTETDELDATYFVLHQLHVIQQAIDELHDYLRKQVSEIKDIERLVKGSADFNHRQLTVLGDAVRDPAAHYTFGSHAANHGVTHETARADLQQLLERGLLERSRRGRQYVFRPVPNLPRVLKTFHQP